jgi:hypothetical protein
LIPILHIFSDIPYEDFRKNATKNGDYTKVMPGLHLSVLLNL